MKTDNRHPFVSTPNNGPCSSCGKKRTDTVHNWTDEQSAVERAEMESLVAKGYSWPEARYAQEHKMLDCQKVRAKESR